MESTAPRFHPVRKHTGNNCRAKRVHGETSASLSGYDEMIIALVAGQVVGDRTQSGCRELLTHQELEKKGGNSVEDSRAHVADQASILKSTS